MRKRLAGIENEYGVVLSEKGYSVAVRRSAVFTGDTVRDELLKSFLTEGARYGCYDSHRLWLPNGGCLYPDQGKLEYASPECSLIRDIVLYNKAGERLVSTFGGVGENRHFHFFKSNVARATNGYGYVSFGCHENYLTFNLPPRDQFISVYMPLVPFFVTRQLYGGSGWWRDGKEDGFMRSQRAAFIGATSSAGTTNPNLGSVRGILNTRGERDTKVPGYQRFHMIMGDANMLEYALFLKVGATTLMLSMLEEGRLPDWKIKSVSTETGEDGAVMAMRHVARQIDLNEKTLLVSDGKDMSWLASPLEVQIRYYEMAHEYAKNTDFPSEEFEEEIRLVLRMWDETNTALASGDDSHLVGRIDWRTKQSIAAARVQRNKELGGTQDDDEIRMDVDDAYHDAEEDSLYSALVERGIAVRMVTDEEIDKAVSEPVPQTPVRGVRSSLRGVAVIDSAKRQLVRPMPGFLDPSWDKVKYSAVGQEVTITSPGIMGMASTTVTRKEDVEFSLDDPLQYESAELEEFLKNR